MRFIAFRLNRVVNILAGIVRDSRGATAIEYGLILALIVIGMVVGLSALANSTIGMWNKVDTKVSQAR
ncbi:Flp family type IVb pilin [Sphingomonas sp. PB2P12]|uniref:Flp family type IVb pilin n=1 Tax=Sphingomonas sandaracina TaxID=3096157 RepID=UPI002FC73CC3